MGSGGEKGIMGIFNILNSSTSVVIISGALSFLPGEIENGLFY